jgi:hypothetical protein
MLLGQWSGDVSMTSRGTLRLHRSGPRPSTTWAQVWAEAFYYMAENNVMFEGILKPSMVTHGARVKDKATPE